MSTLFKRSKESAPSSASSGEHSPRPSNEKLSRQELAALHGAFKEIDTNYKALEPALRTNQVPQAKELLAPLDTVHLACGKNPSATLALSQVLSDMPPVTAHAIRLAVWGYISAYAFGLSTEQAKTLSQTLLLTGLGKGQLNEAQLQRLGPCKVTPNSCLHLELSIRTLYKLKGVPKPIFETMENYCERIDGSGYPNKKSGESVPYLSQLAALIEAYELFVNPLAKIEAILPTEALAELQKHQDTHFDAEHIANFTRAVGIYPPGTFVMLNSGGTAVILEHNGVSKHHARIALLSEKNNQRLKSPKIMDLFTEKKDLIIGLAVPNHLVPKEFLRTSRELFIGGGGGWFGKSIW
ncbi:MAG: hypothetical protein CMF25_00425 [Kangiellaceae bacterium]|nr:hypothetical protein [Kangiellaceae bacterium]|tara:strand:+ start:14057 stop:15115 length:1059 start_codon:yes stop_codon:yes gene_type:complete